MKRLLFHATFVVSLLLFVGALIVWVWSYRGGKSIWLSHARWEQRGNVLLGWNDNLRWIGGKLVLERREEWMPVPPGGAGEIEQKWWQRARLRAASRDVKEPAPMRGPMIRSEGFDVAGVQYARFRLGMLTAHFVAVPLWLLSFLLGTLLLPLVLMHPLRLRWRRLRSGLCLRCGYDLRGSEGRCPECGTSRVSST